MPSTMFAKAKAAAPKTASKAKEKLVVPVQLGDKIKQLMDKRDDAKTLEAEIVSLEGEILPVAKEKFIELVNRHKMRPESFILQSAGANVLVIAQDRYQKMSETMEQTLVENKLEDLIEETTVFSFDPVLLEKYERQISKALEGIKGIPDEDKERLIEAKPVKTIRKGTINQIATFKDPGLVFKIINPVFQLKNSQ